MIHKKLLLITLTFGLAAPTNTMEKFQNSRQLSESEVIIDDYMEACQFNDENTIKQKISKLALYKQRNNTYYQWYIGAYFDPTLAKLLNGEPLCAQGLRACALNEKIKSLSEIKQLLSVSFTENTVKKSLHAALSDKTHELVCKPDAIKKLLEDEQIDPKLIKKIALVSAHNAAVETTRYLIDHHVGCMLNQEIFHKAVRTYEQSTRVNAKDPKDIWHLPKALAHLTLLHEHCKKYNHLHHTSLHTELQSIEPNISVIQWFLRNGYDPNVKNIKGQTALDVIYQHADEFDIKCREIPSDENVQVVTELKKAKAVFGNKKLSALIITRALQSERKESQEKRNLQELQKLMQDIPQLL